MWPDEAPELRSELERRLALLEREVETLAAAGRLGPSSRSIEILRRLEHEMREELSREVDAAAWRTAREQILLLWRRYRRVFEQLAAEGEHRFRARPGRRVGGPRW